MGTSCVARSERNLIKEAFLLMIVKKMIRRLKENGLKATLVHYFNIIATFFINRIRSFAENAKFFLPIKNYIVFECESDMDDNPRAVYEYMVENNYNKKYKFIWLVKNVPFCRQNYAQKNVVFISRSDPSAKNQFKLNYYLSTAKIFVFSHPSWFNKRNKKQIIINTTHGTPFKGKTASSNLGDSFDYTLVASEYTKPWFVKILNCDEKQAFVCSHPRNDFLFNNEKEQILTQLFNWKSDEKVIMCMPTFKQSKYMHDCDAADPYSLTVVDNKNELIQLNKKLNDSKIHMIVKLHPLQSTDDLKLTGLSNIHYIQNSELFEKKIILYKLLGCCDALITDFSSVLFDYLELDRPIGFFTKYFDQYNRGYIMDNPKDYYVGESIDNFDALIEFVDNLKGNIDNYKEKRAQINSLVNRSEESSRCEAFVKNMFELRNVYLDSLSEE